MRITTAIFSAALPALALQEPPSPSVQIPFLPTGRAHDPSEAVDTVRKRRPLQGRFLHITDFHPDPFYKLYSSTSAAAACHRGKGPAGIYGAETSDCDSPIALVNMTIEWVASEFKDKIDFVIWTGDSARHDNDGKLPRTKDQVLSLNRFMVQKMSEAFGKPNGGGDDEHPDADYAIPVVPNLGNNDILPHNILAKGPNEWTKKYASMWKQWIPEAQQHSFQQGGWFYVEVIPHRLAVFSLNTMYFFERNAAADGCAIHSEPGYQQMEWLRVQLQFMRDRGMKAMLIGHVPPLRQEAKTSWDETCWQKYALWLRQYRDVIVSSHYGHFNHDHFLIQDFENIRKQTKKGHMRYLRNENTPDDELSAQTKSDYFLQLRDEWANFPSPPKCKFHRWLGHLGVKKEVKKQKKKQKKKNQKQQKQQKRYFKKIGGPYAERYAATFVGTSIVPNLYPALRVFEYNITGLEDSWDELGAIPQPAPFEVDYSEPESKKEKRKKKNHQFTPPNAPSKSSPPGPAYSPQPLSLIKYTQYFANLTHIHNDFSSSDPPIDGITIDTQKWCEDRHECKVPHHNDEKPHPKTFEYEMLYDTQEDKIYHLKDLTMPSMIDLARRIGDFVPEDDAFVHGEQFSEDDRKEGKKGKRTKKKRKKQTKENGNNKKKHKKHRKEKTPLRRKQNEAWYAFMQRAYVGTRTPEEIASEFGH